MDVTATILKVILDELAKIHGVTPSIPTEFEYHKAIGLVPTVEALCSSAEVIETLDLEDEYCEIRYDDETQSDGEENLTPSNSQEWGSVEIGKETFTVDFMRTVLSFYDSRP